MSEANSAMAIHRLVLIVDRFSLHCNSIQSPVSIVDLRVILTYLIPLLRVYINQHSSNAIQFSSNLYSNVTTSTRINILQCTYVHLRLFHSKLHSPLRVILQGFVTQNATSTTDTQGDNFVFSNIYGQGTEGVNTSRKQWITSTGLS